MLTSPLLATANARSPPVVMPKSPIPALVASIANSKSLLVEFHSIPAYTVPKALNPIAESPGAVKSRRISGLESKTWMSVNGLAVPSPKLPALVNTKLVSVANAPALLNIISRSLPGAPVAPVETSSAVKQNVPSSLQNCTAPTSPSTSTVKDKLVVSSVAGSFGSINKRPPNKAIVLFAAKSTSL